MAHDEHQAFDEQAARQTPGRVPPRPEEGPPPGAAPMVLAGIIIAAGIVCVIVGLIFAGVVLGSDNPYTATNADFAILAVSLMIAGVLIVPFGVGLWGKRKWGVRLNVLAFMGAAFAMLLVVMFIAGGLVFAVPAMVLGVVAILLALGRHSQLSEDEEAAEKAEQKGKTGEKDRAA